MARRAADTSPGDDPHTRSVEDLLREAGMNDAPRRRRRHAADDGDTGVGDAVVPEPTRSEDPVPPDPAPPVTAPPAPPPPIAAPPAAPPPTAQQPTAVPPQAPRQSQRGWSDPPRPEPVPQTPPAAPAPIEPPTSGRASSEQRPLGQLYAFDAHAAAHPVNGHSANGQTNGVNGHGRTNGHSVLDRPQETRQPPPARPAPEPAPAPPEPGRPVPPLGGTGYLPPHRAADDPATAEIARLAPGRAETRPPAPPAPPALPSPPPAAPPVAASPPAAPAAPAAPAYWPQAEPPARTERGRRPERPVVADEHDVDVAPAIHPGRYAAAPADAGIAAYGNPQADLDVDYDHDYDADLDPDLDHDLDADDEHHTVGRQWMFFGLEVGLAILLGLGLSYAFRFIWDLYPYAAAIAAPVAVTGIVAAVGGVRNKMHRGPLRLPLLLILLFVSTLLVVLPAALILSSP